MAHHLVECALKNAKPIVAQHLCLQGRGFLLAHGWQLCGVADHPAIARTAIDELHEVVEQAASQQTAIAKQRRAASADHRGLIDEEQRIAQAVEAQAESSFQTFLPIDAAVNGGSLFTAV